MGREDKEVRGHEQVVRAHLRGEPVDENRLWLAVGYFHANGVSQAEKFTEAEWKKLLRDTKRMYAVEMNEGESEDKKDRGSLGC